MSLQLLRSAELKWWGAFIALINTKEWRNNHPESKALFHHNQIRRATVGTPGGDGPVHPTISNQDFVIQHASAMLYQAKHSDPDIIYCKDHVQWIVDVIQAKNVLAITFMFTISVCPFLSFTPVEAAEKTGTSESSWRNRCNAGLVEGAVKKGKQWLIPEYVLTVKYPDVGEAAFSELN